MESHPYNVGSHKWRRFALLLEYDGTSFAGSQLQPNARTVQGALEAAIVQVTGAAARASFAGRTDSGVHARGQVASFASETRLDARTLRRALNASLPEDVAVREVAEVASDFDPRRQATWRHYRYLIDNRAVRSALERRRAWHVGAALDREAMRLAASGLVGRHDFAAFAGPLEEAEKSTIRELARFEVMPANELLLCVATANAFLPHQVRRMVGSLVEVGRGKLSVEAYVDQLTGPPCSVGPAAPPHGLYLTRVDYAAPLFQPAQGWIQGRRSDRITLRENLHAQS